QDADHGVQLILGHGEGSALHRRDALSGGGVAEIEGGGDHYTGGAVNLLQELVVHQDTAVFGGQKVGAASRSQADFEAAAAHLAGHCANRIIFADFAFFELGDPNCLHALGLQHANVFVADDMAFGQKLLSTWTKNSTAKDPSS